MEMLVQMLGLYTELYLVLGHYYVVATYVSLLILFFQYQCLGLYTNDYIFHFRSFGEYFSS